MQGIKAKRGRQGGRGAEAKGQRDTAPTLGLHCPHPQLPSCPHWPGGNFHTCTRYSLECTFSTSHTRQQLSLWAGSLGRAPWRLRWLWPRSGREEQEHEGRGRRPRAGPRNSPQHAPGYHLCLLRDGAQLRLGHGRAHPQVGVHRGDQVLQSANVTLRGEAALKAGTAHQAPEPPPVSAGPPCPDRCPPPAPTCLSRMILSR